MSPDSSVTYLPDRSDAPSARGSHSLQAEYRKELVVLRPDKCSGVSQREKLFEAMQHDKKVSEGIIKFVLVNKIGQVSFGQPVPLELVEKVLAEPPIQTGGAEPAAGANAA